MKPPIITSFLIAVSAFMMLATPAGGAPSVRDAINKTKDAATTSKKAQSEAQKVAKEREAAKAKKEADAQKKADAEAKKEEPKKSEVAVPGANTANNTNTAAATPAGQRPIPKTPEEFTDWLCEKLNSTPAQKEKILARLQKSYRESKNSMRHIVSEATVATDIGKHMGTLIRAEGWSTNMYSTDEWLAAERAAKGETVAQAR